MRPSPAFRPGRRPVIALALLLGASSACDDPARPVLHPVAQINLEAPSLELRPGRTMLLTALPLDHAGEPVSVPVTWSSGTPNLLTVEPTGLVRAHAPGQAVVRAAAGPVVAQIVLDLINPPAASLTFAQDSFYLVLPGGVAALPLSAVDSVGGVLVGAAPTWRSSAPRIATVTAAGAVTPVAVGRATITASLDDRLADAIVIVDASASETAPFVADVTPALVVPGTPVVIRGERFASTPSANTVLVDGIPLTVTAASPQELTAVLPAAHGHCLPTAAVALQVSTAGGIGVAPVTLRVAPERELAVGEALVLSTASGSACNELVASDGRYLLAISNAARALGAGPIGVALAGRSVGAEPAVSAPLARAEQPAGARWAPGAARTQRRLAAHGTLLRQTRDHLAAAVGLASPHREPDPMLQVPALNGIVPVRIPNLDTQNFCQNFLPINARAVYIGARVVVLEDTSTVIGGAPTTAGQIDHLLVALGTEVETVFWPIVTRFGNPLVMDSRLDDNGRIFLVFTPRMNFLRQGAVLGAVVSCDFFPRAQLASSNVGEVLYAQVPIIADPGTGPGTPDRWRHEIRGVIVHEMKHIVSYAERIVRGQPLEEVWLEEATARHAEELYARALHGTTQGDNTPYSTGIRCEALYGFPAPGCDDDPRSMLPHFEALWSFLDAPAARSPLGGVDAADLSFYGSAWALTRWALDHRGVAEDDLFAAFTVGGLTGLANLEARAGTTWDEMLGRWALAMMADDRAGFTPHEARLTFPSWDLTGIFGGLCLDVGPCAGEPPRHPYFSRPHPLRSDQRAAGHFDLSVGSIQPGGFHAVELLEGGAGHRQLLHLRGVDGAPLPATARLAILRVN
ncbi:MAG: Ig-like domain-containing protein [Gemmatimonadaceae bacterium]